jgi:hypothetical protein
MFVSILITNANPSAEPSCNALFNIAPTVPDICGGVYLNMHTFAVAKMIVFPIVPMKNAGKTKDQYLDGLSANVRRIVAGMRSAKATTRKCFGLLCFPSSVADIPIVGIERVPSGSMRSADWIGDHP